MIIGGSDLEVDSDEFQVCLNRGQLARISTRTTTSLDIDGTNLPFQTLRIERGSALSCTRRIGKHEQLVNVVMPITLRDLVGGINGQWEFVKEALNRSRDCKE